MPPLTANKAIAAVFLIPLVTACSGQVGFTGYLPLNDQTLNADLTVSDPDVEVDPPAPGGDPATVTRAPKGAPASVGALDGSMYSFNIPFSSNSSMIEFNDFGAALPEHAVVTKVTARVHEFAKEDGNHFYFILDFGVKDILAELYDSVSGDALSPNLGQNHKVVSWSVTSGVPIPYREYVLLESVDGSSVMDAAVLNQSTTGLRLQYHNQFFKSDYATVSIDQVELIIDYH